MSGFIEGIDREQTTLFLERLEDWIGEGHLVRAVDLFADELDLAGLGWASPDMRPHGQDDRGILQRFCSSSSSMAI